MIYVFENFELDEEQAELRREGERVPVEPQVFELIKLLISARDRVVARDEIFEVIWDNRIVSDAALSSRIRDARKAIADDGTQQRLIRTVQRRGLRFIGDVRELPHAKSHRVEVPESIGGSRQGAPEDILERPAVAVMPFENLSEDVEDHFMVDGLTREITAALSAWRYFPVISRSTIMKFHTADLSGHDIGVSMGARYLVTGSFRRSGGRIKLRVSLTDTDLDQQIWADNITRDADQLVELEEEIAGQIVTLIAPELKSAEARRIFRRKASDLTTWELAMRSAWLIDQGTEGDFAQAERLAQDAIDRAPEWTLPYTLIAIAKFQQAMLGFSGTDSSKAFSETMEAAKHALEIDRSSWIAHALCAVGELWTNRNHDKALLHVTRAIELNPSAPMNYHFGGCITGFSGDPEGARRHQERLFRLDPLYSYTGVIEADLGLWHLLDQQFMEADDHLTKAHKWDPRYGRALQRQIALGGLNGNRELAQTAAHKLSELGLSLDYEMIAASYPFRNPDHGDLFLDGLRRSGVNL
jgi:TolB-like protein